MAMTTGPESRYDHCVLVQVGPLQARGGIADVMRAIDDWAQVNGLAARMVNTSCPGSIMRRSLTGLAGVSRALWTALLTPHALMHVHSASNGSFLRKSVVVLAAHAVRRPVVFHIHGGAFAEFTNASRFRRACVSMVIAQVDVVLVLNDRMRRLIGELQPRVPIMVVPNPATLLCGEKIDAGQRGVLFLGRLGYWKGTDVLLEAIRALQEEGVTARYTLAGDGDVDDVREAVQRLPRPSEVSVPGWLSSCAVHDLLHTSSIFCLPSRVEALPMALLQAMGHGLAVIATPVGSVADVIENGVNGVLVSPGDSAALTAALRVLLADADLREAMGAAAYALVSGRYAPDVVMQRLDEIYSKLTA